MNTASTSTTTTTTTTRVTQTSNTTANTSLTEGSNIPSPMEVDSGMDNNSNTTTTSKITTPDDVVKWTVDRVVDWAKEIIGDAHAQKLKAQEIDGASLIDMATSEKDKLIAEFIAEPVKLPLGPARKLAAAIKVLACGSTPVLLQDQPAKKPKLEHAPSTATMQLEGIDLDGMKSFITWRSETIQQIESNLQENNVILVRSPPFSGKTGLSQLIEKHFKSTYGANCFRVSLLQIGTKTIEQYWLQKTNTNLEHVFANKEPVVIIIDELQMLYSHADDPIGKMLWNFIKSIDGAPEYKHIKLVAFASYGSGVVGGGLATPYKFQCAKGLELLRCTQNEMQELVNDFNHRNPRREFGVRISPVVQDLLYNMTNGHMGLIARTLWLYQSLNHISTEEQFATYLVSYLFYKEIGDQRGVPRFSTLNDDERAIYKELVLKDEIHSPETGTAEQVCVSLIKSGTLVLNDSKKTVSFSSPLISYIAAIRLYSSDRPTADQAKDIDEFIVMCLHNLRQSFLQNSKGRGSNDKLLERSWQMEFFRAATSCLGRDTHISPDVGHLFGTTGFLDFYVNDTKQWAIELTREGDELGEHVSRFEFGGLYQLIPKKGEAILDFRSETKKPRGLKERVWYILYNNDCSGAVVKRKDKEDINIKFLIDV